VTRVGSSRDNSEEHTHTEAYGVTQVVRNFFGGGTRAQDTMLAISIIVNVLLSVLLYGAWKDLGTKVWLRSDSLTKENAEIRGHVIAIEDLVQSYGMSKDIPKPPPLKEERH